jgi:hypothetical protein
MVAVSSLYFSILMHDVFGCKKWLFPLLWMLLWISAHMFILQVLLDTGIGVFFLFWGGVDH